MRNASFPTYVSNLKRDDNSIWKPIKNKKKPQTSLPPIRKYSIPPEPWAKSDKEKAVLFVEHLSEVFSPHNKDQDPDLVRDLTTETQSPENLQAFTLREIKNEIRKLNSGRTPGIDLITIQTLKKTAIWIPKPHVHIQRQTQTGLLAYIFKTSTDHHGI